MIEYTSSLIDNVKNVKYEEFVDNKILIEACVFELLQLGELSGKVTEDFKRDNTDIPWAEMKGLRNKVVHDYVGVQLHIIWNTIKKDIPELDKKLRSSLMQ